MIHRIAVRCKYETCELSQGSCKGSDPLEEKIGLIVEA